MSMDKTFVRAEKQPIETMIYETNDLYAKQTVVPKAHTYLPQHAHALPHLTLLTNGSVNLWRDGELDAMYEAPCGIYIEAGVKHLFETLEDGTVLYCIHALTTPDALRVLAEHNIV
jgi:quercetin dioxygenase-like cupin family protein